MAIHFKMDVSGDTLIVTADGFDESLEEAERYSLAVMEKAVESGCRKILCNERNLEYRLNKIDTFQLAEFVSTHLPFVGKCAIVANEKYQEDIKFWETVSRNRGVCVKAFESMDDAKKWIQT